MKKIRVILHCILIVSVMFGITATIYLLRNDSEYMTQKSAAEAYASEFYEDTASILEYVGKVAEFNDKYGTDEKEVENTGGYTVGELKELYKKNKNLVYEYESLMDNIFYYGEGSYEYNSVYYDEDEGQYYDEDLEVYYDEEYVKAYGYSSLEEYNKAKKMYSSIYNFLIDYSETIEEEIYVSNFEYYIKYTDQNKKIFEYKSDDGQNILKNSDKYKSHFLFDKLNNTAFMEKLDENAAGFESLIYKCKTFTDYEDFYAVFGVNSEYPYEDIYYYYEKEVVTDEFQIKKHNTCIIVFTIACIVAIISLFILIVLTGRNENKGTKLYFIDKLWWDVTGLCLMMIFIIIFLISEESYVGDIENNEEYYMYLGFYIFAAIESSAIFLLSVIRRIKARCFFRTSLIGVIIYKLIKVFVKLGENMSATKKAFFGASATFVFILIESWFYMQAVYEGDDFFALMWFIFAASIIGFIFWFIWKFIKEYDLIVDETKNIANGDITNKIQIPLRFKHNKKMAEAVNNIGEGINKAVDESVRNERMKTDLITNVSHDIKTPLTSIINYVNLLKMENIENEKVENYIRILDEKSQRLKILTDDLVEASKLSSGVIKLNFEKLNLVELIKQSAGEYEEKFDEKYLDVIMNIPTTPIYVKADGRKMWRVLENLYGNIYKYALKGTRVYVDLVTLNGKIILFVKNISNSPLNFESEELTERFIRGDVSRSTEGSGLGLSIAKSIIDRHGGEFKIVLDGDLFKVIIKLEEYNENIEVEEKEPDENQ